ncbi:MAG: efflux RND transporter permease subunit, partial [Sphingomonadaceae bacterium]|nr:efflux RND transporter permease subunit [Sphingomonadaceae bacterium]
MDLNNISAWSIRNPVVPIVFFVGLMLAGVISFMRMDIQQMPDIEFPVVIVNISQPGAAPTEIETQITQRVEAAVRSISGVNTIGSTARESNSSTFVEFELGEDINGAVAEVKNAVDRIRSEMPDGILEPQIFKASTTAQPIAYFAVKSQDMTLEQVSWFIDDTIAKRLLSVEGLAEVSRGGGVDREIRVTLDPARMQALGVSAGQVNSILRQLNLNAAGGRAEIGGSRQSVRVLGNAQTAFELSQTDISLGAGRAVKLADIARVSDAYGEVVNIAKFRGKSVVTFSISRARGASDVTVFDSAQAELRKLEAENPGLFFEVMFTMVPYARSQYVSSMEALVEGAILAVVVVFLFLRDWRATITSAIAIPLAAIPTFWFMDMLGFTLNMQSLLALSLVAGVLVDDAIVEIENIVRHMRMGKTAYQSSIDAADEIGLAVVATTFSIVAVFLPVGIMPGVSGEFFRAFGLTIVAAVMMSLAVARTITPMVAAYFLHAHGEADHASGKMMERYMGILHWSLDVREAKAMRARIVDVAGRVRDYFLGLLIVLIVIAAFVFPAKLVFDWATDNDLPELILLGLAVLAGFLTAAATLFAVNRGLQAKGGRFARWYEFMAGRLSARLRDHRFWMLGAGAGALLLTGLVARLLPMEFMPQQDSDFVGVQITMVPGTTLAQTEAVSDRVRQILVEDPDTDYVFQRILEGNGMVMATLRDDRKKKSKELENKLTPLFQQIPDARISFQSMANSQGSGTGRDISVMLSGNNSELLNQTAAQLVEEMRGLDLVVAPRVSADMRRPEIVIRPRHKIAAELGVSTAALSHTIRIATIGEIDQNAAKFSLSDRQVPIRVRLSESARRNIANIQNLPVPTSNG